MVTILDLPQRLSEFRSGPFASRFIRRLNAAGVRVAGVIDWSERANRVLDGLWVSNIERGLDLELPVVIGFHNPDANVKNVQARLSELGLSKTLSAPEKNNPVHLECLSPRAKSKH